MKQRKLRKLVSPALIGGIAVCIGLFLSAGTKSEAVEHEASGDLRAGFETPPQTALPLVWWHWMGGNITKEGIRLDLDWMHRVGIGGFQAFEGTMKTPTVVDHPMAYMSRDWKDAFRYAVGIGARYGMEMAVASSPGWSETGGPWVRPEDGMKKLVWSEVRVRGGTQFHGTIPRPPATVGPFQNVPVTLSPNKTFSPAIPEYYADSELIAYRAPADDVVPQALHAKISVSSGQIDPARLSDGDLVNTVSLPAAPVGRQSWIRFEFPRRQTIRAVSLAMAPPKTYADIDTSPTPILEASDDGSHFHKICAIQTLEHGFSPRGNVTQTTVAFAPVTARFYRVSWKTPGEKANATPLKEYRIAELALSPSARVNHFEEKAGFSTAVDLMQHPTPRDDPSAAVARHDVVILTGKMSADGQLNWTAPPGRDWVILRFGYSLTGAKNSPAPPEATGIEVDKLDHVAVRRYLEHYLDFFKGEMGQHGLRDITNDSWEAGNQNWTGDMVAKFTALRGYDPRPWMPVLAGRVIESAAASDKFLWDFRQTIGELITKEHYGEIDAVLREHGLGRYSESHEDFRAFLADGMEVKKGSRVPMGAMAAIKPGQYEVPHGDADDRETASVAHIYGQNIAAAESMTTCDASQAWAWTPATLKPIVDQEFLNGINRIVIHESALQPLVGKQPGMTLGGCGQWFNRNETWAEQAAAWTGYLARSSFMLQQGRFVADILYFYGQDTNITARFEDESPPVPRGYDFDYINADGLIHQLSVQDGLIQTHSGMRYRVIVLDSHARYISLSVMRALRRLVEQGAILVGDKPVDTPSLADDPAAFKRLNDELFGTGSGVHFIGKGKVYAGEEVSAVLKTTGIQPDFDYENLRGDTRVEFIHRQIEGGELYYVDNRSDRPAEMNASFRVTGKAPEFWYPETGKAVPASYAISERRTSVPLTLAPWESVFVVFRKPAMEPVRTLPKQYQTVLGTMDGPWDVVFQKDRGAPSSATFDKLGSWTASPNVGIKYFSGTASYRKTIMAPASWFDQKGTIWLDMGQVDNLATVRVNGHALGTLWHAPFRIDVRAALKPGQNQIESDVTNAWVNRLIGDRQPNAKTKYTFATWPAYTKDSSLQMSGLLGPVRIIHQMEENRPRKNSH